MPSSVTLASTSGGGNATRAFQNCSSLTSFVFPQCSQTVNLRGMFFGCTSLSTLDLSGMSNLNGMNADINNGAERPTKSLIGLTNIIFPQTVTSSFYYNSGGVLQYTGQLVKDIVLPAIASGTQSSCGANFFDHSGITGVTTPVGLRALGNNFCNYCQNLTKVIISEPTLNRIGNYAFCDCPLLTEITFAGTMAQ